eukprot:SAG22_NODE_3901_length_1477_cov_1.063861_1_plen_88_part_00
MLAVHCLQRLAEERPALVQSICAVTTQRKGSYPMALAGINICQLIAELLALDTIDPPDLGDPDDPGPVGGPAYYQNRLPSFKEDTCR